MKKPCLFTGMLLTVTLCAATLAYGIDRNREDTQALRKFATRYGDIVNNSHLDLSCNACHKTIPEDTNVLAVLATLKERPSALCTGCHPDYANIHPSDHEPTMKTPELLPLDDRGNITCTTCHRMHDPTAEYKLLRGFLDGEFQHRRDLCFSCHGADFSELNPHRAQGGQKRCTFCHVTVPSLTDTAETVRFRTNVIQMCNFCHDVQSRFHPLNVDPNIEIPDGLPRGKDGSINCGTCHNPHGEADTVHFLRKQYVQSIEVGTGRAHGEDPDCNACHVGKQTPGEPVKLRFGANITVLCNSCHGTSSDIHPVDIRIPRGIRRPDELPLSEDKRITCLTCHDVECKVFDRQEKKEADVSLGAILSGDKEAIQKALYTRGEKPLPDSVSQVITRFFDRNRGVNDLCFKCHPEEQFLGFSPHMGIDYRKMDVIDSKYCRYCHDIDPSRGAGTLEQVAFISNPRMICIRCHPVRPHPAGREHMVEPQNVRVPQELPLDMDGKISCSTCHDPHVSTLGTLKSRAEGQALCVQCHRRK